MSQDNLLLDSISEQAVCGILYLHGEFMDPFMTMYDKDERKTLGNYNQASAERHEAVPERCRSRSFLCTSTTRIQFRTVPTRTRNEFFPKERERQERGTSSRQWNKNDENGGNELVLRRPDYNKQLSSYTVEKGEF